MTSIFVAKKSGNAMIAAQAIKTLIDYFDCGSYIHKVLFS
ncbi:hypothetical protein PCIT_b0843 [Pseudoalteromonas citrea]|uniref:Uncharacterized protein n=1 Tax=Pseudoalteromonas citrea TaxID=43655 RepID=A0AAD4FQ76_9GAMM|nr:hypothetical protein PCIT_b0843 [Pseudoalteromonas citrea]